MPDPASYRPKTGEIPTDPGVYRFRDPHGRVIYVGKAKNLRQRLTSYFQDQRHLTPKTRSMVTTAGSVEWTVVGSEQESLQLEFTWIKEFSPRFNIMFRDDKTYPYLAVTMGEKYPRALVMRGDKRKGTKYFGPFYPAKAVRETLDTVLRVFPVRSCTAGVFNRAERSGRPCLLGYIGKCSAPCVGRVTPEEHRDLANELCDFMGGDGTKFIRQIEGRMKQAVAQLDYESAARHRDDIAALRRVFERNAVVLDEKTDADIFGLEEDDLEAAVQVFHVRGGRIRGQRGWVMEKVEDVTDGQLLEQLLQQVYGDMEDADRMPREVLVPVQPDDQEALTGWLSGLRGAKVDVRVPQRGAKRELAQTVQENARQALALHKTRRAGDVTVRSAGLQQIQDALDLPEPPLRMEGYDNSHVSGTNVVGSMVVFEDGLPKKSDYRRFTVKGEAARDDTSSMYDVISRRFQHYLEELAGESELVSGEVDAEEKAPARFSYPPSLVVVDGGPPQVAAAQQALADLGITDISVVGLAKRLEEVWVPGDDFPVILPRNSEGLFLLQRLRDESHRFAITFHRERRGKSMIQSLLDDVPGLGASKRAALLKHFGSVKKMRAASLEELQQVKGVGPTLAAAVLSALSDESA
ncbi:excinuclease ABC subunit UvrC [Galactobacter caseinivorans]|uniref:UvrABC system protein C n=1 Tax=Galactobacter caseinivorans TaxID=2676123 RepID=A0A496PKX3_9MICC|nr:excinuclease ABC subunit UvrC [Galactobacter caseinivorans]RKW71057.1 excinuclease ABC subunit UvrC [Galactobacter caseinivorans]